MADSKDNKNIGSSENFADDLDSMLNDAESSMDEQDEFIDDDDAIDRLLMDDAFAEDDQVDSLLEESGSGQETSNDTDEFDVDDLINSVSTEKEAEVDDFAEDDFAETEELEEQQPEISVNKTEETVEDEFDVDDLLNSVAAEASDEIDVFSEDEPEQGQTAPVKDDVVSENNETEENQEDMEDEFDIDDLIDSESPKKQAASEVGDDKADDDFLMADFDISADDEEGLVESDIDEEESHSDLDVSSSEHNEELHNELNAQAAQTTQALAQANSAIKKLSAQVSKLGSSNEGLTEQIKEITATTTEKADLAAEEIDTLQKEQRKLRKALKESESKVPVITYVVMAIAILALLVGGGLGAIGFGAQTDVESLAELVATLEEDIEIISAKDSTSDVKEINFKINALEIKDEGLDSQLAELTQEIQKPNTLKTVVDDLAVQNDHAQIAIEKLLASVETLEQQKVIAASKRKVKKAKKVIVKVEWVVNLVSFKQEWYAKRKAEEFERKGIPAKVEKVKVNGEKWFRLRVKGFKSKYEAAAYAVKVKKILNLSSVWVTKA